MLNYRFLPYLQKNIQYNMSTSQPYSILIADDDSDEIELLMESFENQSQFKIEFVAKNGLEFVDYMKRNPNSIDVAISDMFMPALTGIEAIQELEANNLLDRTLAVIFSNTINIENNPRFKATDKLKFYTKPSSIAEYKNFPSKLLQLLAKFESTTSL